MTRFVLACSSSGALLAGGVSAGAAQEASRSSAGAAGESYEGVAPGAGHAPPATERLARRRGRRASVAILTWPGFQMLPSGGSRFFVQTTHPVEPQIHRLEGRIEIVFPRTTIHLANSGRWLETRHFETPVTRARLLRRGRDMVLVMYLRGESAPHLGTGPSEGGFHYTYVDFDAGHWLPPPEEAPAGSVGVVSTDAPPSAAAVTRSAPVHDPLDDERPPPIQGPNP